MSQTRLPRRQWMALQPPPDGLVEVRRVARQRRRRRAAAVAAVGSGVATVVTLVALLGGGGGVAVLKTVPAAIQPGPTTANSSPSATIRVAAPAQRHAPGAAPSTAVGRGGQPATNPGGSTTGRDGSSSSTQPQLTRSQSTYTGAARVCSGSTSGTGTQFHSSLNWCLTALAQPARGGTQLTVNLCRDSSGGGSLTFETTSEADLTVQRDGKTVWDWAYDHPARPSSHTLSSPLNGCWNWSLLWPDTTQSGTSAGHGTFTFVATSTAQELTGGPTTSTTFRV